MTIPPLNAKIMLESNPLKSSMLVGILDVLRLREASVVSHPALARFLEAAFLRENSYIRGVMIIVIITMGILIILIVLMSLIMLLIIVGSDTTRASERPSPDCYTIVCYIISYCITHIYAHLYNNDDDNTTNNHVRSYYNPMNYNSEMCCKFSRLHRIRGNAITYIFMILIVISISRSSSNILI